LRQSVNDWTTCPVDRPTRSYCIEPARKIRVLEERKGVLQVTAEWTGETPVDEIIRNEREKRLKRLAGA